MNKIKENNNDRHNYIIVIYYIMKYCVFTCKEFKLILHEKVRDAKTEFKLTPLFKYGQ